MRSDLSHITARAHRFNRNLLRTFSACNPTPGTGIAEAIKAAFAATAAGALLRNGSTNLVYRPRYIRIIPTVVPASATRAELVIVVDSGVTRYSSGGSSLTPKNRDMRSNVTSSAVVRFGALVTAAATANVRQMARAQLSTTIPVAFEETLITFGGFDANGFNTLGSTAGQRRVVDVGEIVIGPSQEMIVHDYYPGNAATAQSAEVEICWQESQK